MKTNIVSGATLAVAAIALAIGGLSPTPASAKHRTVWCKGINSCKGHGYETASRTSKGNNSCKGMGYLPTKSIAACEAKGGTVG